MEILFEGIERFAEAFKDMKVFRVRASWLLDTAYVLRTRWMEVTLVPTAWLEKAPELKQSLMSQGEWERFLDDWVKQYAGLDVRFPDVRSGTR